MRKYLYVLLLSLCASGGSAQSYRSRMETAIDMGTYSDFFTYSDTRNTINYTDDYSRLFYDESTNEYYSPPPARDVFYKLTIANKSMQLNINDYGNSFVYGTRIYILDADGNELAYCKPYDLLYSTFVYSLQPGSYYIVMEAATGDHAREDDGITAIEVEAVAKPPGDDFFYPAILGTFHTDFDTSHTISNYLTGGYMMADYVCDLKNGSEADFHEYRRDLVHQFTITKPMDITLDNIGSAKIESMHPLYIRLLSSSRDTIPEESIEYSYPSIQKIHYELQPGTYYVYSKFTMDNYTEAKYVLNINGKEQLVGSVSSNPIDAGSKSINFTYSHTQNTGLFSKNRLNQKPGKEVFYKFSLTVPMEITVDNCGSAVTDTYLEIYAEDNRPSHYVYYANDTYTGSGACANTQHAYIKVPVLLPGTYYVVSDGAQDGNITTTIKGTTIGPMGDMLTTAIDAGTHDAGFHFTDTKNTASAFTDQFPGMSTKDVFYKFTLTEVMDVAVSHCGSAVPDTYMSLLDAHGVVLYSNDNYTGEGKCTSTGNALIKVEQMPPGTYYVVSEGNTQNGNITTTIEARSTSGTLHTTAGQPHIISIVPTVQTDSLETTTTGQLQRSVQYFNHFGYPTVNIELDAVPLGGDRVTLQETDGYFRKSKSWLPIAKNTHGGQYLSPEQLQIEVKAATLYENDQRPYSQTVYDGSPLDLVVEQYGPGDDWFKNKRSVKSDRIANAGTSGPLACARYMLGGSPAARTFTKTGFYADNELYVTKTTNEDNHDSYEFKDKAGRMVLSRRMNGTLPHDTYYVYDNYGNLSFVLPPLASDALTATNTTWDESATAVKNFAYIYKYDAYNRCISKKLPGCEPIYSIYDKADRVIYTQDGEQRAKATPEWTFSIPDAFGRVALTGKCTNSLSFQSNPLADILVKAEYTGGTNAFKGYTVSGITLTSPEILSVNYYDNYTFLNTNGITGAGYKDYGKADIQLDSYQETYVEATRSITLQPGFYVPAGSNFHAVVSGGTTDSLPEGGFGVRYTSAKGMLTGTLTAQLESGGVISSDYLYSVKYYDNRGRVVQAAEKVTGGSNRLSYKYNFAGSPLFVLESQSVQGLETNILTAYTYDQANRRLTEKVTVNGVEQAAVAYTYDEAGRLNGQKYAKGSWSTAESMGYNVRSWLTEKSGSYFSMGLRYNNILTPGSTKLFGGGISEWSWQHTSGSNNMYSLKYDAAERLTGAQQYVSDGSNWTDATSHYTENGISYDKNGNILTLQRSAGGSIVDNLTYSYEGNRLSALNESVASPGASDILVQGGTAQGTYQYNANGNMIYDSRKSLTYGYNFLNLTDMVKQGQTVKATYKWAADGSKLSVRDGTGTNGFDYAGSVVYAKNGSGINVDAIHFDHGVIRKQADGYMVNYFLRDHLGSTRVVVDGNGAVLEKNDYYPFGARHKRNDYVASDNRYKYNGKEEQVVGDVGFLDYGARMYDAGIGRWTAVDPLTEKFLYISPYHYTDNNPVNNIDPNGKEIMWDASSITFMGDDAKAAFNAYKQSRQGAGEDDD
ncbi:RHS repeat domain-containing protein, partial [Pararcticibacter amylolyticus]